MKTHVEIYSDYVCPYCVLFEAVLDQASRGIDITVEWKPVELRPHPNATLRPEDDYLPDVWKRSVYPLAEALNIALKLPSISPQPYSRLAHEGYRFAEIAGRAAEYNAAVFKAFFQEDRDIGDVDVLLSIAASIGLDQNEFRTALESGQFTSAHNASLAEAAELGVHSVPSVYINGQPQPLSYDADTLRSLLVGN